jgi:hypothetical protein
MIAFCVISATLAVPKQPTFGTVVADTKAIQFDIDAAKLLLQEMLDDPDKVHEKDYFPDRKLPVAVVSGKFGYNDMFKEPMKGTCRGVRAFVEKMNIATADVEKLAVCGSTFPDYIMNDPTLQKHIKFLEDPDDVSSRGGGYWFWKSVIANHTMHVVPLGGFVVYMDSDMNIHPGGWLSNYFHEAMDHMIDHHADFVSKQLGWIERQWTKEATFKMFNVGKKSSIRQSGQFAGGIWIARVTPKMRDFVERQAMNVRNFRLLSDEKLHPRNRYLRENRHDQSFWSLMIKTSMLKMCVAGGSYMTEEGTLLYPETEQWNDYYTENGIQKKEAWPLVEKTCRIATSKYLFTDSQLPKHCHRRKKCIVPASKFQGPSRDWNHYDFTYFSHMRPQHELLRNLPEVWGKYYTQKKGHTYSD